MFKHYYIKFKYFNLKLSNHGHWVRMIPSLSGSLYKFDGENLDRIPFTIDSLLKSSFRYNDDLIISGMFSVLVIK